MTAGALSESVRMRFGKGMQSPSACQNSLEMVTGASQGWGRPASPTCTMLRHHWRIPEPDGCWVAHTQNNLQLPPEPPVIERQRHCILQAKQGWWMHPCVRASCMCALHKGARKHRVDPRGGLLGASSCGGATKVPPASTL